MTIQTDLFVQGLWEENVWTGGLFLSSFASDLAMLLKATEGSSTQMDLISRNLMVDTSAGPISHINESGGLVTTAATVPWVTQHGFTSVGAVPQKCLYPNDPGEWVLFSGATRTATGGVFGPYTEYNIIDAGDVGDDVIFWSSLTSGQPSGILYFAVYYNAGTSGKIRLKANDLTSGLDCLYRGDIGSAIVNVNNSGTLTILSDTYDAVKGHRILTGSVLFNSLNNTLKLHIGPNSSTNQTIKVLGAAVSQHQAILSDLYIPAAGAPVTTATRAGTESQTISDKMLDALDGVADGVEVLTNGDFSTGDFTGWIAAGPPSTAEVIDHEGVTNAAHIIGNSDQGYNQQGIASGLYGAVRFKIKVVSGGVYLGKSNNKVAGINFVNAAWAEYAYRWTSGDTIFRFYASDVGSEFYIADIEYIPISPAKGQIQTEVTFPSYVPTGIHKLFQFSGIAWISFDGTNNLLILTDGTNTISVPFTPSIATPYPIWAAWYTDAMQLSATIAGTETISAQADFTGTMLETDTTKVTLGDSASTALIAVGEKITIKPFSGVFKEAT